VIYAKANLVALGLTAPDMAPITTAQTSWATAFLAHVAAVNAAKAAKQTKDENRAAYVAAIRPLVRRLQASVELPTCFALVNKDPSYTLTAVGAPMPLLHVAQEIDDAALAAGAMLQPGQDIPSATFRIASGVPDGKVSWRI